MKIRLDNWLVENNHAINKSKARQYIIEGKKIYVNKVLIRKPGYFIDPENSIIDIQENGIEFVSRAGLKLYKAIEEWKLNLDELVCLDIGASTGGFTQCCLINGAKKVYSVDVGKDQLVDEIKNNPKVINMEKYNFKNALKKDFNDKIMFFCCDVSFISVAKILPIAEKIVEDKSIGVILIKPQFESEINEVKSGKVNSKEIHKKDIIKVIDYANNSNFNALNLSYSPIKGNKKQNIEYLLLLKKGTGVNNIKEEEIDKVIESVWK